MTISESNFGFVYDLYTQKFSKYTEILKEIKKYQIDLYDYAKELWEKENSPLLFNENDKIYGISLFLHERLPSLKVSKSIDKMDFDKCEYIITNISYDLCTQENYIDLLKTGRTWYITNSAILYPVEIPKPIIPVCIIELTFPNYEDTETYEILSPQLKFYKKI